MQPKQGGRVLQRVTVCYSAAGVSNAIRLLVLQHCSGSAAEEIPAEGGAATYFRYHRATRSSDS